MSHYKPDPNKSVNLTIDGREVTVPEGTRILEAARKAGVKIPTLCDFQPSLKSVASTMRGSPPDHPDLCKRAVCRICVVECDGRGKLAAACANDVYEGLNVVTNNARILGIRKTIVELLLANHPQDCLDCIRSTNCELQSLAAEFGIRQLISHDMTDHRPAVVESNTLVRDMGKCVKCGRCVEVCQEIQTIRSINSSHRSFRYEICAPYGQSLDDGPCVFCGQCAELCPVGAIYGYEQTAEAWEAINDGERQVIAQISPALCGTLDGLLGLPAGSISPGRMVTALKRSGFDRVFDGGFFTNAAQAEERNELANRLKLPMISGCSQGWIKFAETFYPDLKEHFFTGKDSRQVFAELVKTEYPQSKITAVSISPCIAQKYTYRRSAPNTDLVLTVDELAQMFRQRGINFNGLPETPFDVLPGETPKATPDPGIKTLTVYGFANARTIMDSIRKGECDAALVHIMSCPVKKAQCMVC